MLARIDPTFIDRFGTYVDAMFHDIAHGSNGDSRAVGRGQIFFPLSRHKSWFDGHSFATGIFPFGDGKSQESSSEAVNCYYGAYLWSLVRHAEEDTDVTDFAKLLLATEIRGAKKYWHMIPPKSFDSSNYNETLDGRKSDLSHVYPAAFEENYMVGNVGMLDVAANTWFGADPLYVHMIQALPITSATRLLFEKNYVEQEFPYLMATQSSVEMAWRGYTTSIHAIVDPNQAWKEAQDLVSYELDAALSKSQVLYFISQIPGFKVTLKPTSESGNENKKLSDRVSDNANSTASSSSSYSSCNVNPGCSAQGLMGLCCPTTHGVFLECCQLVKT